ncbi:MAG: pyruvate kinase [Actinobacteria bacterium 13_1_20CM_3_68_9]|nr:MAG: pyruvate kinase [Actinobacteria bacterium 13_1_20CM_3_68_9]
MAAEPTQARSDSAASGWRRTKIVATIGPATRSVEKMAELIRAGADVFRLNFSHGGRDDHATSIEMAREAAQLAGREVGLLGDLPGPKLRIDEVEGGVVELRKGSELTLTTGEQMGRPDHLPVSWEGLPDAVSEGDEVYLADGRVRLRVLGAKPGEIRCAVEAGGAVASHQGLNMPGTEVPLPSASHADLNWVDFAVQHGIDLLAVSFVRRAEDLEPVERRVRAGAADIPLIAKIEKPQAAENAEAIIRAALSGIMVARGDLGVEIPIERVPTVQRQLLALAGRHSRPSITATQMLASMVGSPRPTRAEVSDVAGAIFQGTDAVMLSEETAVGEHPVEAVHFMDRIAREAEPDLPYGDWLFNRVAHARSCRGGRAHPQRSHGAASLGAPAKGAGVGGLTQDRDGAPASAPVRGQMRPRRGLDEPANPAGRVRPAREGRGRRPQRRPDRDHRRAPRAGARHESVRGPPGAVGALVPATVGRAVREPAG